MNLPDNHVKLPGIDFESLAYHDYGDRRFERARAFVFHGAESALTNEWAVTNYLRREHGANPNGVSATFAIEVNGKKGQMLGLNRVSGSIRASLATSGPRLCREDGPFYGYRHAKGALRDWWGSFVNSAVWSVETGMQARLGPNDAVADSAVELFAELYDYNKGDLIPLGHGDFAHCYKGCPGDTRAVKEMFRRMGGHGLDFVPPATPHPVPDIPDPDPSPEPVQTEEEPMDLNAFNPLRIGDVPAGARFKPTLKGPFPDSDAWKVHKAGSVPVLGFASGFALIALSWADEDHLVWMTRSDIPSASLRERSIVKEVRVEVPVPGAPGAPDAAAVAAAIKAGIGAAVAPGLAEVQAGVAKLTSAAAGVDR